MFWFNRIPYELPLTPQFYIVRNKKGTIKSDWCPHLWGYLYESPTISLSTESLTMLGILNVGTTVYFHQKPSNKKIDLAFSEKFWRSNSENKLLDYFHHHILEICRPYIMVRRSKIIDLTRAIAESKK